MPKNEETEVNVSELKTIEILQRDLKTANSIHEAVKAANGWRNGKAVTTEEYKKAVDKFLNSPIKGGK